MITWRWQFFSDPGVFVDEADEYLRQNALQCSIVASVAARVRDDDRHPDEVPGAPHWWGVVRAGGEGPIAGVAMRSSSMNGRPVYVPPLPPGAAEALGWVLRGRGESVVVTSGELRAARQTLQVFADAGDGVAAQPIRELVSTRLHELDQLTVLSAEHGAARMASVDDLALVADWLDAFAAAADEQAGRRVKAHRSHADPQALRQRLESGSFMFWTVGGVPVHMSGFNGPVFGIARIGPVYTPAEHRGQGYAGAAVSALAQRLSEEGARVCLYTDLANPVSNALYARIGFRPVMDTGVFALS